MKLQWRREALPQQALATIQDNPALMAVLESILQDMLVNTPLPNNFPKWHIISSEIILVEDRSQYLVQREFINDGTISLGLDAELRVEP